MEIFTSCKHTMQSCIDSHSFAIAHLYNDEKTMNIHIHDCYEIYYSISGGKQFLIDNRFYSFNPGDIFFINQYESHYLAQVDNGRHERIVISIFPEYLTGLCTEHSDLNYCFSCRNTPQGHKLSLTADEQKRFLYYINRFPDHTGFGQEVLDHAVFLELMVFLNRVFLKHCDLNLDNHESNNLIHREQIDSILSFINQNLAEELSIQILSEHFYLSSSYLCRIFKESTGTTINKYITAKRISRAKAYLSEGRSVTDSCGLCGFKDYSNFLRSFTRAVGISPKKYAEVSP